MLINTILTTIIASAAPAAPSAIHDRVERAAHAYQAKPLEDARTELKAVLANDASNVETLYMLAYVDWRLTYALWADEGKKRVRLKLLAEAQSSLERLLEQQAHNGEAMILLSSILGATIAHQPERGASLGMKASRLAEQAAKFAPQSPRVSLLRGIDLLFRPAMYGGGLKAAATTLEHAKALFDREPATAPWPNWGRTDMYAWLGQVAVKQGDKAKARALYEQALKEEPNAAWIKYRLLPATK